jgi:hypothetical protein
VIRAVLARVSQAHSCQSRFSKPPVVSVHTVVSTRTHLQAAAVDRVHSHATSVKQAHPKRYVPTKLRAFQHFPATTAMYMEYFMLAIFLVLKRYDCMYLYIIYRVVQDLEHHAMNDDAKSKAR